MFILKQKPTYLWPVSIKLPKDGGAYEKHTFDIEFKKLTQERLKEINQAIQSENSEMTDAVLSHEIIVGWKGIAGDDGNELPFSQGNLDALLNIPTVASAIIEAFFQSIAGAKRKN